MTHQLSKGARFWLAPVVLAASLYACGSSTENGNGGTGATGATGPGNGAANGSACTDNADCASNVCTDNVCVGDGTGTPAGGDCKADADCASGACTDGVCDPGTSGAGGTTGTSGTGAPGAMCTSGDDCKSGVCVSGICGSGTGTGTGSGTTTTPGPHFTGSGNGFRPLTTGCGPDTATQCTGTCEQTGGDPGVTVIRPPVTLCFAGDGDPTPNDPSAVIEQVIETLNGVSYVHIRITFDPNFTDNTYGAGAQGWSPKRGHTFVQDLTKSDHTELLLTNGDTDTVMNFKIDLVSPDPTQDCGFGSLGVTGGDGSVIVGDPKDVLAVATSSERNLNGCGYCMNDACAPSGDCTVDSPATDKNFTPNAGTPNWDYRIVYEAWIALDAFGDAGFGQAYITYTHSSPGKAGDTIMVMPTPCPPEWDDPYCPPSVIAEGGNCFGTPSGGGGGGAPGAAGSGSGGPTDTPDCPVNQQTYVTTEGASICTPIPFGGNPGMTPCPAGYHLDLATEGKYCLPD